MVAGPAKEHTMWKKIAVAAGVGAAVIGTGGAALAASSTTATPSTPSASSTSSTASAKHHHRDPLTRALHAQWVTHDKKTNTDVTHDEIKGTVTAVSTSSITVKATDGVTQTYAVSSATKIHAKGDTKTSPGTIGQVKTSDTAIVVGTGATSLTATHIDDRGVAKAPVAKPTS
jgi:hypothetical protein